MHNSNWKLNSNKCILNACFAAVRRLDFFFIDASIKQIGMQKRVKNQLADSQ